MHGQQNVKNWNLGCL